MTPKTVQTFAGHASLQITMDQIAKGLFGTTKSSDWPKKPPAKLLA
jgi:hypothetical protein